MLGLNLLRLRQQKILKRNPSSAWLIEKSTRKLESNKYDIRRQRRFQVILMLETKNKKINWYYFCVLKMKVENEKLSEMVMEDLEWRQKMCVTMAEELNGIWVVMDNTETEQEEEFVIK
ncbi:hypothetical protein GmHk_02G003221 [Glycine max]|nr:hypothetical protein GmHk_02G003221 [Glycine max]